MSPRTRLLDTDAIDRRHEFALWRPVSAKL
jgi:hypothetical protein